MKKHRKDFSPIQFIGRKRFDELATRFGVEDGARTLSTSQMTDALLGAVTLRLDSFREIEGVLGVARSTLSSAMTSRSSGFFMDLCDKILLVMRSKATVGSRIAFWWLKSHLNIRRLPVKNKNAVEIQLAISVLFLLLLRLKQMREKFGGTLWALLRELRMMLSRQARMAVGCCTARRRRVLPAASLRPTGS